MPLVLHEKPSHVPVIDSKLAHKRGWSWRLLRGEKSTRSSPSLRPSSSPGPILKKGRSALNVVAPWDDPFEPVPPLPTTSFPPNTQDLHFVPIISNGSLMSDDFPTNPKPPRRKSSNKLARTLGVLPDGSKSAPRKSEKILGAEASGSSRQDVTSLKKSLSLSTSFATIPAILEPPSLPQPRKSRSRVSLSTLNTDDVHRFGLTDDLSENWGDIQSGSPASIYSSYSPISPITFNPPTPITTKPPRRLPSADNVKLEDVTTPSSPRPYLDATLSRARSMSFGPLRPKMGRLAHLGSTVEPETRRPHTASSASSRVPFKAGWLESTPAVLEEEASKARSFVVDHPEYIDEYRNWSGQWNQDNVQDVIKLLRTLK
ncbi:hypothetical protein DXG01_003212 [Tephrocybe rancida]|nr:hypothetical protein DXG01_003212 [Tephrocybe rancida]